MMMKNKGKNAWTRLGVSDAMLRIATIFLRAAGARVSWRYQDIVKSGLNRIHCRVLH
jgi:hypothetical protein